MHRRHAPFARAEAENGPCGGSVEALIRPGESFGAEPTVDRGGKPRP